MKDEALRVMDADELSVFEINSDIFTGCMFLLVGITVGVAT